MVEHLRPRGDKDVSLTCHMGGRPPTRLKTHAVPDLAFSEMRFLSAQPRDKEEVQVTAELTKKRLKKNPTRAEQENISACFAAKQSSLAKTDTNAADHWRRSARQAEVGSLYTDKELHRPAAMPLTGKAEIFQKPFLGFGGRCNSGFIDGWSALDRLRTLSEHVRVLAPPKRSSQVREG